MRKSGKKETRGKNDGIMLMVMLPFLLAKPQLLVLRRHDNLVPVSTLGNKCPAEVIIIFTGRIGFPNVIKR